MRNKQEEVQKIIWVMMKKKLRKKKIKEST